MAKSKTGQNVGKSKVIKSSTGGGVRGGGKSSGASKTSVKAAGKA